MTPITFLTRDEVSIWIDAPPEAVYDLVADVTRTPEWSPEVIRCEWVDPAQGPAVGARFKARNKVSWMSWSNEPVVEVAERGREFAFSRRERIGGAVLWRYRFEASGTGTKVTESYEVTRPIPRLSYVGWWIGGARDRVGALRQGMETTLQRLKDAAEPPARPSG
jgi:hypothetical protein